MTNEHAHTSPQSVEVDEHELKQELRSRLQSFYKESQGSLFTRVKRLFKDKFLDHYAPHIDTSGYQHPKAEDISERSRVNRTVYALKKIKEFNHHFFPFEEQQIINPLQPGLTPVLIKIGFSAFQAVYLTYAWTTWSINRRTVGIFAGVWLAQQVVESLPNLANETIQTFRRKSLARAYIDAYGYDFFHDILDPNYDINKLRNLHNKLLA